MSTTGAQLAKDLPQRPGADRENAILDLVKSGAAILKWVPLVVESGGVRATFYVTAEPLMLGSSWEDGFYPGVTAATMQRIADYYNATLLTPKLVDEIWRKADVRVDPFVGMASTPADVQVMANTDTFVRHSQIIKNKIRDKRASSGKPSLVANIGKYWVVGAFTSLRQGIKGAAAIPASENYGFFATRPGGRSVTGIPGVTVVQTPGHAHDYNHSDYSQVVMLVSRTVEVCQPSGVSGLGIDCRDGSPCQAPGGPGTVRCMDIYDVANDPELARLLSHEGTINMRLPGIPYDAPSSCVVPAMSGLGADGFGEMICSRPPPAPGPIGRGSGGPARPPGASTPVAAPSGGKPSPMGVAKAGGAPSPAKATPSGGVPRRTKLGDRGPDVVAWQSFLISQGYNLGASGADGAHGQATEKASLDWEKKGGKASAAASAFGRGGFPNLGLALVVVIGAAGAGWVAYDYVAKR